MRSGIQQNFSSSIRNQCGVCSAATFASAFGSTLTATQVYARYGTSFGENGLLNEYAKKNGKTYVSREAYNKEKAKQVLKSGSPILMFTKNSVWTNSQHFMTLVDLKEENGQTYVYVLNPAAELYSNPDKYKGWQNIDSLGIIHMSYYR